MSGTPVSELPPHHSPKPGDTDLGVLWIAYWLGRVQRI